MGEPVRGDLFRDTNNGEIMRYLSQHLDRGDVGSVEYSCEIVFPEEMAGKRRYVCIYSIVGPFSSVEPINEMEALAWVSR